MVKGFVAALVVATLGSCQGELEQRCEAACARPFELAEQKAGGSEAVWKTLPEAQRAKAMQRWEEWKSAHDTRAAEWQSSCIPSCMNHGQDAMIDCRQHAPNVGAWKRCGAGQ